MMSISLPPRLGHAAFQPQRRPIRSSVERDRICCVRPKGSRPGWRSARFPPRLPAIQMLSATTTDSKSVTIEYQVNQPTDASTPIQFGIYRSSDGQFNSSDSLVDTFTLAPPARRRRQIAATLDQNGQPATAVGTHQLTIPLPQGLPPFPEKPYVLVVADPSSPSATTDPQQTASFRTYTIGIVTHGGIQDTSWKHGPPWELEIAHDDEARGLRCGDPV